MSRCYKLNYACSKKRLNDLIHKGLEYEKEHGLEQPEKETIIVRKDQRIAELEKENAELKAKLQEAKQKLEEME